MPKGGEKWPPEVAIYASPHKRRSRMCGRGAGVNCPHPLGPSEGYALRTCKSFGEVREQMARVMVYSS